MAKNKHDEQLNIVNELIRREDVDFKTGLTSEEVEDRTLRGLVNVSDASKGKTTWEIIRDNVFTFFNILYLVITVLLCIAQSWSNLTYLPVILFNLIIGIVQELKAKKMIEELSLVQASKAIVVRDGTEQEIDNTEVVIDDVIKIQIGNQIYADAVVLDGVIEVNESMITGEADAIVKKPGDNLYSGSYVVSGTAYSRVEHVGKENYIEKLAQEAKKQKNNKSELLRTLNIIVTVIGFIIIPLFVVQFFNNYGWRLEWDYQAFCQTITKVSGSIIGLIPSGLFLLTSIALVKGVITLGSKYNTSVQELYCIEMLARVDTLCLDKTGTITDGTMRVVDCIEIKNNTDYTIKDIVGSLMNSFNETNATSEAMIRFFGKNQILKPVQFLPFSSQRKYSAVTFEGVGTFYLGAPEFVLVDNLEKVKAKVDSLAKQGCRVLVLGHTVTGLKKSTLSSVVRPVALIVLQDHIRDEAYDTIEFFKKNGVELKVISGDNPITVSEIAHRAGIENYNKYVSLEGLSDDEVKDIAFDYTIFGRVTPNQKRALVQALKEQKRTVAMTGDGVNDILAMKESDCSIAFGSGSDACRNVANIVLMDSNFASMPKVVSEGRRVINNVQRTSTLFLNKTILTLLLTVFYLILREPYPFEPKQIVFMVELFLIGFPALVISLQPNTEKVVGKFITNVMKNALPGALTVLIMNILIYYIGSYTNIIDDLNNPNILHTITLFVTSGVCIAVLFRMCKPFNWLRRAVFALAVLGVGLSVLLCYTTEFFRGILLLENLNTDQILFLIICMLTISPVYNFILKIFNKFKDIKIYDLNN